ncbi:MAG: internalin-like protein [Ferruginibacter sp.]|uniref:leucine-rich repeat domain-containing protein n=1 Tax=Ferruginibacter sp. TaxID=1940288 RepID=UPI002659CACA|nr:hypothetical protein [Ferruginibacter sp.]MDB5280237.1 internalin-like protein [Ferruginibacter sp.]
MKTFVPALLLAFTGLLVSCGKKNDVAVSKDEVGISLFSIDTTKTKLFKESFNGKTEGYSVGLIPDVSTPLTVNFSVTTNPANYNTKLEYTIVNSDGSAVPLSSYSISANQINFTVPGNYRITGAVPGGANNNPSAVTPEIKIQVAPNVPDNNLRTELKKISTLHFTGEILNVTTSQSSGTLSLGNLMLQSLEGIKYLKNIDTLYCQANTLTSLDVSGMTSLKWLDCSFNQLRSLNLTGLSNLFLLGCGNNKLPSLDVQGLNNLSALFCDANQLTALNVTGLTKLRSLTFSNNQVSLIDLSGLMDLGYLDCSSNPLSSLNVTSFTKMQTLMCINNNFTSLDVQQLSQLVAFSCYSNALSSLTFSTAPNSYPKLIDLRVYDTFACTPGIKQAKIDRGAALSVRLFNANGLVNNDYDASTCP